MKFLLLSSMRNHLGRLLATALAVVLSVAFIVTTLITMASYTDSITKSLTAELANTDVWVGPQPNALNNELERKLVKDVEKIRKLPGVAAVSPRTMAMGEVNHDGRRSNARLLAQVDPSLQWNSLTRGEWPTKPDEVSISEGTAETMKVSVGDTMVITPLGVSKPVTVRVVGITSGSSAMDMGIPVLTLTHEGLTALQSPTMATTELLVHATPGTTTPELVSSIKQTVSDENLQVLTREEAADRQVKQLSGSSSSLLAMLAAFAGLSLIVAGYVIANTFQVLVAQRIKELALLRCIGAESRQVRTLILAEAALVGLAASAVGTLLGIGISALFVQLAKGSGFTIDHLVVPGYAPLAGLVAGTLATVACAYGAARKATQVRPITALQPMEATTQNTVPRARIILGSLLVLAGVAGLVLAARGTGGDAAIFLGIGAGMVCLVGVLMLGAVVLPPLIHRVGMLISPLGPTTELAAANSMRNPLRTAATATSLLIGVTVLVLLVTGITSTRESITSEIDTQRPIDLVVRTTDSFTPAEITGIKQTQGITATASLESAPITAATSGGDKKLMAQGMDQAQLDQVLHAPKQLAPEPGHMKANTSDFPGMHSGDTVTVFGDTGSLPVTLDLSDKGENGAVALNQADLAKLSTKLHTNQMYMKVDSSLSAQQIQTIVSDLNSLNPHFQVGGGAQERADYIKILDTVLVVMISLLAVAIIIAIVGIGNTTALSIIERRRESAMLRAVGLERRQLVVMVMIEAALTAVVAAICGTILGVAFGWSGILSISASMAKLPLHLYVPWSQIGLIVVGAGVAGLVAAALPALGASRRRPIQDLATI